MAPDVGGHDDDGVLEIHRPPLPVREPAVIQDLQQDVEHVRVSLLDLVEQDHGIGPAAHRFGQVAPLVVPHVPGRRADQPGDRVFFHVLRHVDADHSPFVVEEELGECARELGFPHPRGAEKNEGAHGTPDVLQPGACAADRVRHRLERGVLPEDPFPQPVLHVDQLLDFPFQHPGDRDPGPFGDHIGDVLLVDLFLQELPGGLELGQLLVFRRQPGPEFDQGAVAQLGRPA